MENEFSSHFPNRYNFQNVFLYNMKNRLRLCIILSLCLLLISTWLIFTILDRLNRLDSSARELKKQETFLLVLITSSVQHSSKREAIRNSWFKLNSPLSKHFFVVGGKDSHREAGLLSESIKYGDILILPSANDTYEALPEKVLKAFVHFHSTWTFKFLLKCDDDSFVRIPDIVDELRTRFAATRNLYWGFFNGNARVKKRGRWKETKWILCDRYLPYALGGGYVLSYSIIQFVARNYQDLNIYQTEDVSVGAWLAPVNVTRIHDPRFDTEYLSRGCSNTYLVTHKRTAADMLFFYNNIVSTGNLCDTEFKLRASYLYDWDVEPSKCCSRTNASIP